MLENTSLIYICKYSVNCGASLNLLPEFPQEFSLAYFYVKTKKLKGRS